MSDILMNLFKHNSTRLYGRLSTKYSCSVDKQFLLKRGRHNLYFELHVHGLINFYRRSKAACGRTAEDCAPGLVLGLRQCSH